MHNHNQRRISAILLISCVFLATLIQKAKGDPATIIAAAGLAVSLFDSQGCPTFTGAKLCGCRSFSAVIQSSNKFESPNVQGPTLMWHHNDYAWGSLCSLGTQVITNGNSGGVSVGNSVDSYKTGVEANIHYQLFNKEKTIAYNCFVRLFVVNPLVGSLGYRADLQGDQCSDLVIEQGQVVNGAHSIIQYFVYYKPNARSAIAHSEIDSEIAAARSAAESAGSICNGDGWVEISDNGSNHLKSLRIQAESIAQVKLPRGSKCEVVGLPVITRACAREETEDGDNKPGVLYQYEATPEYRCSEESAENFAESVMGTIRIFA
jgi:hypothetical protein